MKRTSSKARIPHTNPPFPETLFVIHEGDPGEEVLIADPDLDTLASLGTPQRAAKYKRVDIGNILTSVDFDSDLK